MSAYFNVRNTFPKSDPFILGHPVYIRNDGVFVVETCCEEIIQCNATVKSDYRILVKI
jgi:hypothetical protein